MACSTGPRFSLFQRWGPDELANRLEISRTALLSDREREDGLAHARHAEADCRGGSEVPMEDLLGQERRSRRHGGGRRSE